MKINKLEKKQTNIFNKMMDSIAFAIGGYILISFGLRGLIHIAEFIISLPFFLLDSDVYRIMDSVSNKVGNFINVIGIIIAVICLIDAFFLGRKYCKLSKVIKK